MEREKAVPMDSMGVKERDDGSSEHGIARLRGDIEVLAQAHWAPKGRLDKPLRLLRALLDEHEATGDERDVRLRGEWTAMPRWQRETITNREDESWHEAERLIDLY